MVMKKVKKLSVLLLCAVMLLAGCGKGGTEKTAVDNNADLSKYPIETDVTLSYFRAMPVNVATLVENYGETEYAKEFEKRVGVKIEYLHPGANAIVEALNLMVASDELPDIIEYAWAFDYVGGPAKAILDEVIIPLNDYKEYAPNFFNLLKENREYDRASKTDDGEYYGFPMIQNGPLLSISAGPVVRADWLRELGISEPETIAEWEAMLTAFKEKKGAKAPLSFNYGLSNQFFAFLDAPKAPYIEDGKVVYGAAQPKFREALEIAHDWFNKGLLDKNIASVDGKMAGSQILSGDTGASFMSGGSGLGPHIISGQAENPDFDLIGVRYPTKNKGEINYSTPTSRPIGGAYTASISTQCTNPAIAAKVLDYVYSEEGQILTNFGIEGKTFNMVDGVPTYSDLIMKNPDGLTISQALGMYVKSGIGAYGVVDEGYIKQYYELPQQKKALEAWTIGAEKSMMRGLPTITPKSEELSEYANIMNEVDKYRDQMIIKFITGIEPLDKFDEYVETMNKYGLERAMEIQTAALKRYEKR